MNNLHFQEFRRMLSKSVINSSKEKTISSTKTSHRKNKKIFIKYIPQTLNLKSYYSIQNKKKENTFLSYNDLDNKNLSSPKNKKKLKNIPQTIDKSFRKNILFNYHNSIAINFSSFKNNKNNINKLSSDHITIDSSSIINENHGSSKSCKNVHLNKEFDNIKFKCLLLLKRYNNLIIQCQKEVKNN